MARSKQRSAGFPTCCIADFQSANRSNLPGSHEYHTPLNRLVRPATIENRTALTRAEETIRQLNEQLENAVVGAFAENNILIAFPQRDLYVNVPRPQYLRL